MLLDQWWLAWLMAPVVGTIVVGAVIAMLISASTSVVRHG